MTGAKLIISRIEKTGEQQFAMVLKEFWQDPDANHIFNLLNLCYWSFGATVQLNSYIYW